MILTGPFRVPFADCHLDLHLDRRQLLVTDCADVLAGETLPDVQ